MQTTDDEPEFVRFLQPDTFNKDYLENEDYPPPPPDDHSSGGGGGGCFIATCAYGNYDHPDVLFLRLYRDLELAEHGPGRLFIRFYYSVGPWLASAIMPFPLLRRAARWFLARLVGRMQARRLRGKATSHGLGLLLAFMVLGIGPTPGMTETIQRSQQVFVATGSGGSVIEYAILVACAHGWAESRALGQVRCRLYAVSVTPV